MTSAINDSDIIFDYSSEEKRLTVIVKGSMHFGQRKSFLSNVKEINQEIKECVVDLTRTTHIDSTALGMLIILKENPFIKNAEFTVKTYKNTTISKILHSHRLDKIFKIA